MVKQSIWSKFEGDLVAEVSQRLRESLREVPFLEILRIDQQVPIAFGNRPDLVIDVRGPGGPQRLLVEIKSEGSPRMLRNAAEALKGRLTNVRGAYGIMAAPYVSDRGRSFCRENGVGCFDLAGNVFLSFDQVFIERSGRRNPAPERRLRRSLFAPRSSRALRVFLANPTRPWYVRDAAAEAGISPALTSKLKQRLRDQDLLGEKLRAFWITKPVELLNDWAGAYTYKKNELHYFYSALSIPALEDRLAVECETRGIRYGLTMFSGANRIAPYTVYNRAFAYVESRLKEVADALDLKEVPSGANLVLLRPYDEGVFYGLRDIGGAKVVSDVQLYLDLKSYEARGEEAATFLLETWIGKRWNTSLNQTTPA